jgi:hypothetical protein
MATKPKTTIARKAWAIVTPKGRVQLDTVSGSRREAKMYLSHYDEEMGNRVLPVTVSFDEAQSR